MTKAIPALRIQEEMDGYLHPVGGDVPSLDVLDVRPYLKAADTGRELGEAINFRVTIAQDDLPGMLENPALPARLSGMVESTLLDPQPLEVVDGRFTLLEENPNDVDTANMRYHMVLRSTTDPTKTFLFEGHKNVTVGSMLRAWGATTTLYVVIYEGQAARPEAARAFGVMHIGLRGVHRLVADAEVLNVDKVEEEKYRARFGAMFIHSLWPYYGGELDELGQFAHGTQGSSDQVIQQAAEEWLCDSAGSWHARGDGVAVPCSRLLRFPGGDKGPVVLAGGFAMSATSLYTDGVRPGLAKALQEGGYDVWLFDYRAGTDLPSSKTQFNIDDVARTDWPRAVAQILKTTGARDLQAFGHCVGSVSLLMAMLDGPGMAGKIRSAVCSQFSLHPVTSRLKVLESDAHMGSVLKGLGLGLVSPDSSRSDKHALIDSALRLVPLPRGEQCTLATCRWVNAIFGLTHRHAQLDEATHQALPSLFGVANMSSLQHLGLMMQRGRAVDAKGDDSYLRHGERLAGIPIMFMAGAHNYIFHPEGTERTLEWLLASGGSPERHSIHRLEEYAHLDGLIGRDAARDVFPTIIDHLDHYAGVKT